MSDVLERPRYRLTAPFFAPNDTLYPEGTTITWLDTPNEFMVPLNEAANSKMRDWLDFLDQQAAIKAALDGKSFIKRAGDLGDVVAAAIADRPREPRQLPRDNGPVPVRPDMVSANERRRRMNERGAALVATEAPPPPKRNDPATPILGTIQAGDAGFVGRGG